MRWIDRFRRPRGPERLYVIYDTGGAGRLVGVFDDPARANAVAGANPAYFRLTPCTPNTITAAALDWANADVRRSLEG